MHQPRRITTNLPFSRANGIVVGKPLRGFGLDQ